MPNISAVIITYNEERNIGRCIDSLAGIADEILVVDSFSTDRTEAICREKGVKFIQHEFEGHIEQKNFALEQAGFPHVLSLDADEALSDELRKSILQVKDNWKCNGYTMNRLANYCGKWVKHSGWYPDRKLRLFDKRKGKWGGVNPHDKVIMEAGSNTGFLKGDLLHYTFYTREEHLRQIEKFTDIAANALYEKGRRSGTVKMLINPVAKFMKNYFLGLGFLDGAVGWHICRMSARATYLKYAKLKDLQEHTGTQDKG